MKLATFLLGKVIINLIISKFQFYLLSAWRNWRKETQPWLWPVEVVWQFQFLRFSKKILECKLLYFLNEFCKNFVEILIYSGYSLHRSPWEYSLSMGLLQQWMWILERKILQYGYDSCFSLQKFLRLQDHDRSYHRRKESTM